MPTVDTELKTKNTLPDIFRTINGINLDIGPLDRLRDQGATSDPVRWDKGENATKIRSNFPRIILRDALGHELDTFTTLQEAIYRAKWNVQQSGQAKEPLEWRLPKAPAPARPDLTRTFPPLKHPPAHPPDNKLKGRFDSNRVLEFDVEDVGFVKESLQYLPYAPSLSFLKQEILVGPKTYFQIVGTMLLHKKFLSQTEKRHAVYNFPGFCSGCIRMGLCYGCERSTEIHFHEDKPVKTGGGFTYFKKDRPENEIKSKNPINWKIHHPDQALKKLMEEYAGVELDGAIPDEIKQHLDKHGGHRERIISNIPDFAREMKQYNDKERVIKGDGHLPDIHVKYGPGGEGYDDTEGQNKGQGDERDTDLERYGDSRHNVYEDGRDYRGRGQNDLDPRDVKVYIEGQDDLDEDDEDDYQGQGRHRGGRGMGHSSGLDGTKSWSKTQSGYNTNGDEAGRSASYDRYDRHGHRLPKYRRVESGSDEENEGGHSDTGEYSSHRSRRKEKLYQAPPAFKLKKSPKRSLVSKSPFSTDRVYDLPKGKGLNIKKSDKQPTQFKEFRNVDVSWKEPKKFELKKNEQKPTKFWSGPPQKKKDKKKGDKSHGIRRVPSPRSISPDSGLDSEFLTDTTIKSEPLEPVREETLTITPDMSLSERGGTPLQLRVKSPAPEKPLRSVTPPRRREIVKKVKKPLQPSPIPIPAEPKPPIKEKTPSPEPVEERPVSREISFDFVKEKSIPELPPIEIPELPEISEKQSEYKGVKKEKKLIEVTPEIPEPKKKLPPPPKLAPRIKTRTSRKSKVAEAPVTTQELQQLSDPLDFLAKYCIINPDRLPYYERVFNGAVDIQTPRYTRDNMAARGGIVHLPPAQLSQHELNMLKDLTVITHAQTPRREGVSVPEQYLEKLNYSIEFIKTKQDALQDHMQELQSEKIHLMAQMAKQLDRDIVRLDYKTKGGKKKKKKKKKKKSEEPDYETMGAMSVPKNFMPQRASDITDEVIVSRMDDKMLKKVKKDPTVKKLQIQISRDIEKLKHFDQRVAQIEDEKDLVGLYCMDYYFNEQDESMPPYAFRRQQSRLYQKLHPDPDVEMNTEEVEAALQQINNKLLSEKEFQYIYFILDLPKREKINFRLFSIIAALSEKVTQMDPMIRKLINKVDYNALDVKMEKSKELFELLQDESVLPVGNAPAETLAVELTAGGLTPEHTSYVLSKFNREGKGFVDFLDFVTYIPLFIDIHKRIIQDPFNDSLDV